VPPGPCPPCLGILVVGGYYNGATSMWLPLADRHPHPSLPSPSQGRTLQRFGPRLDAPQWEWLASLSKERKWAPAVGFVGDRLTLAGGGDYGDETVESLTGRSWRRSRSAPDSCFTRLFTGSTCSTSASSQWECPCPRNGSRTASSRNKRNKQPQFPHLSSVSLHTLDDVLICLLKIKTNKQQVRLLPALSSCWEPNCPSG
jgi:hypothetical protein